jgi:hypothetical protein
LKGLLSLPLFFGIITSGVILSFCAFEILIVDDYCSIEFTGKFNFAAYMIIEILIFSRASENLKMASEKVAEKIYSSRWLDIKTNKKGLRTLMLFSSQRALKPVKLSALGFSEISYETFVKVSE